MNPRRVPQSIAVSRFDLYHPTMHSESRRLTLASSTAVLGVVTQLALTNNPNGDCTVANLRGSLVRPLIESNGKGCRQLYCGLGSLPHSTFSRVSTPDHTRAYGITDQGGPFALSTFRRD